MDRITLNPRTTDLSGRVFDRLTAVEPVRTKKYTRTTVVYYRCLCQCGKESEVADSNLTTGKVRSCGCLASEIAGKASITHGMTDTPEYEAWCLIKKRCTNPSDKFYHRYGGRGITMHPTWVASFEAFLNDVGPRPTPEHSIDRVDNEKGYEPGNCKWSTAKEQARNRSTTVRLTIGGETKSMAEWADIYGLPYATVQQRIAKYGFTHIEALTKPKRKGP